MLHFVEENLDAGVDPLAEIAQVFILTFAALKARGHNMVMIILGQCLFACNNNVRVVKMRSFIAHSTMLFW